MISALQKERLLYQPKLPLIFTRDFNEIGLQTGGSTQALSDQEKLKELFPLTYGAPLASFSSEKGKNPRALRIGVLLSGGQAPGGHNVLVGLFEALQKMSQDSVLLGFKGGPSGLLKNDFLVLDGALIAKYRNTGGFDMIASGRTKLDSKEDYAQALFVAKKNALDALIVVGGDDSNTNAAVLAEYFAAASSQTVVIGVPKTIDGDLKNEYIETSFGFDTAVKTYSELIGNIARDALSARKYWHFIKLMGRSASHITLEAALSTHPNICLISEELAVRKVSLRALVTEMAAVVRSRAQKGEQFGLVLIPEGLIEFIPEVACLISELNDTLAHHQQVFETLKDFAKKIDFIAQHLSQDSADVFLSLPHDIQDQLLMDRDPHGNVQVSRIETEKLLAEMVQKELNQEVPFSPLTHFFGYEGRCAFPSNFDADYCYALGYNAALLAHFGLNGYLSSVRNLCAPVSSWVPGGIPLTMMMNIEQRHGQAKAVIKKALVDLEGRPFQTLLSSREQWALGHDYLFPGAIQYFGPSSVCDTKTQTLLLERS